MFDFKAALSSFKAHVGAWLVIFLLVVVFLSAPFLLVYRTVREKVPGASALPPK